MAETQRRDSWAAQENLRRQEAHARLDLAWARDDTLIDWMQKTADSGAGFSPDQVGSSFVPKRGERLFGAFAGCQLLDLQRGATSYVGGHAGFSFRLSRGVTYRVGASKGTATTAPESLKVADGGNAVVTDRRMVFHGERSNREWAFAKLVSIQHDPNEPITLIHVSNRQKISGISYPADQAPLVRFALELGMATEKGDRRALLASLAADRREHAAQRPRPPVLVPPADAPSRAASIGSLVRAGLTGRPGQSRGRRVAHTAIAGVVLLATFSGISGALGGARSSGTPVISATVAPAPADSPTVVQPTVVQPPAPAPTPTLPPDAPDQIIKVGAKPAAPKLLPTQGPKVRVGAICRDGTTSDATGSGACSWHDGVRTWVYELPPKLIANKETNSERTATGAGAPPRVIGVARSRARPGRYTSTSRGASGHGELAPSHFA